MNPGPSSVAGRGVELPAAALDALRAQGLLVSDAFPAHHVSHPLGRCIARPAAGVAGARATWGSTGLALDTPAVTLFALDTGWFVEVWEFTPGLGPGDFRHRHDTWSAAVADVLAYLLGPTNRPSLRAAPRLDPLD